MGRPNTTITLVHERKDVGLILHLEALEYRVGGVLVAGLEELGLEALRVGLGACAKVHFLLWALLDCARYDCVAGSSSRYEEGRWIPQRLRMSGGSVAFGVGDGQENRKVKRTVFVNKV